MLINTSFYIPSLFFFLEIFLHAFLQKKVLHLLLCLYSIYIFHRGSLHQIIFILFLITLSDFVMFSVYGASLIFLIPLSFLVYFIRSLLEPTSNFPLYITLLLSMLCRLLLCWFFWPHMSLRYYTFYELCANIIVLSIFLKFLFKGRLDNRF
jgi:hypothetical protein